MAIPALERAGWGRSHRLPIFPCGVVSFLGRAAKHAGRAALRVALVATLLLIGGIGHEAFASDLLIRNARVVDVTPSSRPPVGEVSVLVRNGRIVELGGDVTAEGVPTIDARGGFLLPGLFDAHVHLGWGPGSALREPTRPDAWRAFQAHYLRAYLACGVTTVLDPGAPVEVVRDVRTWLSAGNPGPRYLTLGPLLMPPDGLPKGYPNDWWETVSSSEEVEAALDRIQELGAVGVKVYLERGGWSFLGEFPIHSPEVREAIRGEAKKRGLPIYVHATSEEDQGIALEMEAHALVHAIQLQNQDLSYAYVQRMARSGTYQITTLSVMDAPLAMFHPERLDEPILQLVVPPSELEAARRPEAGSEAWLAQGRQVVPWLPDFLLRIATRFVLRETAQREAIERSQRSIRQLHRAGVPVVLGTDSPGLPQAIYSFHGATTLRELELLQEAGLSPQEVLASATRVPAEMLGLQNEVGSVEVGKRADLVVTRDDPTADVSALRTIQWVVQDGVARTPAEWMAR